MVNRSDAYGSEYFTKTYGVYTDCIRIWWYVDLVEELNPESVLDIGCGTGLLVKHLNDRNIKAHGLDVSGHCYLNRVTPEITTWDVTNIPWPIKDKEYDLCFSSELFECIPADQIDNVINEIRRVSKRGLHLIDSLNLNHVPKEVSADLASWQTRMPDQKVIEAVAPISKPIKSLTWNNGPVKVNLGSWTRMYFHNWFNVDVAPLQDFAKEFGFKFIQMDVLKEAPPSNSTTAMVAMHLLNHLTFHEGAAVMSMAWEALMAGGMIRVSVPDVKKLAKMYHNGELSKFDELNNDIKYGHHSDKFFHLLAGHKSLHDIDTIVALLHNAGFTKIQQMPFAVSSSEHIKTETIDPLPDMSLYVEARKFVL